MYVLQPSGLCVIQYGLNAPSIIFPRIVVQIPGRKLITKNLRIKILSQRLRQIVIVLVTNK